MRLLYLPALLAMLSAVQCSEASISEEVIVAPAPELEAEQPFEAGTVATFKSEKVNTQGERPFLRVFFGNDMGVLDSIHYFTNKQSKPLLVDLIEQVFVEDDEELFIEGTLLLPGDSTRYDFGILPDRLYLVQPDTSFLDFIYHE
jgi:hypothetical protein